jgi:hypothetical protein
VHHHEAVAVALNAPFEPAALGERHGGRFGLGGVRFMGYVRSSNRSSP